MVGLNGAYNLRWGGRLEVVCVCVCVCIPTWVGDLGVRETCKAAVLAAVPSHLQEVRRARQLAAAAHVLRDLGPAIAVQLQRLQQQQRFLCRPARRVTRGLGQGRVAVWILLCACVCMHGVQAWGSLRGLDGMQCAAVAGEGACMDTSRTLHTLQKVAACTSCFRALFTQLGVE